MTWPLLETNKQNLQKPKTHKQIPTPSQPKLKPETNKEKQPQTKSIMQIKKPNKSQHVYF